MNIVAIHQNEPRAGTLIIAEGFQRRHNNVTRLVEKHRERMESFGTIVSKRLQTKGRPIEEYLLNENQALFLGTLFSNSETVLDFKQNLIKEFSRVRNQLLSLQTTKHTSEYQLSRAKGKLIRREATDTMKAFSEYAKSQGSTHADRYYMAITSMVNAALFVVHGKFKNLRESLSTRQLMTVATVEQIVDRALRDGMNDNLEYKIVFQLAKSRVLQFAILFGKTDVIEHAVEHEYQPALIA